MQCRAEGIRGAEPGHGLQLLEVARVRPRAVALSEGHADVPTPRALLASKQARTGKPTPCRQPLRAWPQLQHAVASVYIAVPAHLCGGTETGLRHMKEMLRGSSDSAVKAHRVAELRADWASLGTYSLQLFLASSHTA